VGVGGQDSDDDNFSEDEEEFDEALPGRAAKKGRKPSKKKKKKAKFIGGKKAQERAAITNVPKKFKPVPLGGQILEDFSKGFTNALRYVGAMAPPSDRPTGRKKLCPVTGLHGIYLDGGSGIRYATPSALEHINERAPPWLNTMGGNATYFEAMKSVQNSMLGEENHL